MPFLPLGTFSLRNGSGLRLKSASSAGSRPSTPEALAASTIVWALVQHVADRAGPGLVVGVQVENTLQVAK